MATNELSEAAKKLIEEWSNEKLTPEQVKYNRKASGETEEEGVRYTNEFAGKRASEYPTFSLSDGKVKLSGSSDLIKSDIVSSASDLIKEYYKGADLSVEQNAESLQTALEKINEQIKSQMQYQEYADFLDKSGFSDEAYRNYALTKTETDPTTTTNLMNSKKKIWAFDKDGNKIQKTPAEWLAYWTAEYTPEERIKLWIGSAEALSEAKTDDDLYRGIPYLIMGQHEAQNVPAGVWNQVNPFDDGKTYKDAKVNAPIYGFDDVSSWEAFWDAFASTNKEAFARMVKFAGTSAEASPLSYYLKQPDVATPEDWGAKNGLENVSDKTLLNISRDDWNKYADIANNYFFKKLDTSRGTPMEQLIADYGEEEAAKILFVSEFSTKAGAIGADKRVDRDATYERYETFKGLQEGYQTKEPQSPLAKWGREKSAWGREKEKEMEEHIANMGIIAPSATTAGVVGGTIARMMAEQLALNLVSSGALSAQKIVSNLSRKGWKAVGLDAATLGQKVASKSPALSKALYAMANGSIEGTKGASKVIYVMGTISKAMARELGEDVIRGLVDDALTANSLDSQGNLDPDLLLENVYMNALMLGMAHGARGVLRGIGAAVGSAKARNIDGVELNSTQRNQLDQLQKALDDQNTRVKLKGYTTDGNPIVTAYGRTKVLDQLTPTGDVTDQIVKITGVAAPTVDRTIDKVVNDTDISEQIKTKVAQATEGIDTTKSGWKKELKENLENLTDDEIREAFPEGVVKVGDETIRIDTKNFTAGDIFRTTGKELRDLDEAIYTLKSARNNIRDFASASSAILRYAPEFADNFADAVETFARDNNMSVHDVMVALRDSRIAKGETIPGLKDLWDNNWKPLQDTMLDLEESFTGKRPQSVDFYTRDMIKGTFVPKGQGAWGIDEGGVAELLGGEAGFDLTASSTARNTGKLAEMAADQLEDDPRVLAQEFVASRMQSIWDSSEQGKVYSTMREAHEAGEYDFTEEDAIKSVRATEQVAKDVGESEGVKEIQELSNVQPLGNEFDKNAGGADLVVSPKMEDVEELSFTRYQVPKSYINKQGEIDLSRSPFNPFESDIFKEHKAVHNSDYKKYSKEVDKVFDKWDSDAGKALDAADKSNVSLEDSENYRKAMADAMAKSPLPEVPESLLNSEAYRNARLNISSLVDSSPLVDFYTMQNDTLGAIRRELRNTGYDNLSPEMKARVDAVDNNISQELENDMVLYRGETMSDYADSLKAGDQIDSSAWTYASPFKDVTAEYRMGETAAKKNKLDGGVLYRYHTKSGQPAYFAPGSDITDSTNYEIMLPRNINGTVTKVTNNKAGKVFGKFVPRKIVDVNVDISGVANGQKVNWGDGVTIIDRIYTEEALMTGLREAGAKLDARLDDEIKNLEARKADVSKQQPETIIDDIDNEIKQVNKELKVARTELESAREALNGVTTEAELESARTHLEAAKEEYERQIRHYREKGDSDPAASAGAQYRAVRNAEKEFWKLQKAQKIDQGALDKRSLNVTKAMTVVSGLEARKAELEAQKTNLRQPAATVEPDGTLKTSTGKTGKAAVDELAAADKKRVVDVQKKFNESAKRSNAAEKLSNNSGYRNRGVGVSARDLPKPVGVRYIPKDPFKGISGMVNDHFIKALSIVMKFNGHDAAGNAKTINISAYDGGYKMYAEAGAFARNVIVDIQRGDSLWDAINKQITDNGFFIEPSEYQRKRYGALTASDQAAKVTDDIISRIGKDDRRFDAFDDSGTVKNTEALLSILTTRFRGQGIKDFSKFLRKADMSTFSEGQRKWLNRRFYEMTASVNKKTFGYWATKLAKAFMRLRYDSNMALNFKNGQLQLTEGHRAYTMNKLGDFASMLKRMATDSEFRQTASDYAYILAAQSMGRGLAKSDLDSFAETISKVGAASDITKNGIYTNIDNVNKMFGKVESDSLAMIEGGEYAKNLFLIAGFLEAGEKQGLKGADLDTYIRNRFNTEALAGTNVGKIGLNDSTIGQVTFMYLGFPIRNLALEWHMLRGGGLRGDFLGTLEYLSKMLGAKGLLWALEAPWGYSLATVLGYDPFGFTESFDPITTDWQDRDPFWRWVDLGVDYNPFTQGAIISAFADVYHAYRAAEEEAREDYKKKHNGSTEGFVWTLSDAGAAEMVELLKGFTPGYTAYSRVAGEVSDLDRGYRTSMSGNRQYEANTDLPNVLWGALAGRRNTANARDYFQTSDPIGGIAEGGLAGLGQAFERGINPFRGFREFDPMDSDTYEDWFDGSYLDQQNWNSGIYAFRDEAQEIKDRYERYGTDVSSQNARENEFGDLRERLEKFVQAYTDKHPEGISVSKQNQLINIFNLSEGQTLDEAVREAAGEADYSEWEAAKSRYSQGDFPTPYGMTQSKTDEVDYAQAPELQRVLSEQRYGIDSTAAPAIKELYNEQMFDTPEGRMTMKDYHDKVYARLSEEWDKSKPDYDRISEIQEAYLEVISKNVIQPILNTYGSQVLSAGKSSDIMQEFGKMLNGMIPSDEYRLDKKGRRIFQSTPYMTVDIKKWLNKNYKDYASSVNVTNRGTQQRITSIRESIDAGRSSTAKAKARALIQDIGRGRASVSRDELEWLQGVLND